MSFAPKQPILVYIASDVRSGSTLLDLILGSHPLIASVGEIQFLSDHFLRTGTGYSWDWRCTCGEYFDVCPFWREVNRKLEIDTGLTVNSIDTWVRGTKQFFPILLLPKNKLANLRHSLNMVQRGQEAAQNCWYIVDSLYEETGRKIIVDSSKNAEQFRYLYFWRPKSIRMIYLVRDGRGVICSKITREGDSARKASRTWVLENIKMLAVRALIPKHQSIFLKYEDLCKDPQHTFNRLTGFLDLPPEKIKFSKSNRHNVGGSPHRFDTANTNIKLDERWKQKLSAKDKKVFHVIGGWLNRLLGYK